MPAAPSATSVRPLRQGRPIVSETIDGDVAGRAARAARPAARGPRRPGPWAAAPAGTGPRWTRRCRPTAITKPWWVCTIRVGPRRATTRAVSAASSLLARGGPRRPVGRHVDQPALGLGHDLAGDHEHVAVAQPRRGARDQRGQVVTGRDVADAVHRQDLQASSRSPARPCTIAAVAGSSVIHSGAARTSTPGTAAPASTCRPASRRGGRPATRAVQRADAGRRARRRRSTARHLSAMPAHRRAADDRRDADDRRGAGDDRLAQPRHGQDRRDADHRVARRDQHHVGVGERLQHAGRRLGRLRADEDEPVRSAPRPGGGPTTPGSGSPALARRGRPRRGSPAGRRWPAAGVRPAASARTAPR